MIPFAFTLKVFIHKQPKKQLLEYWRVYRLSDALYNLVVLRVDLTSVPIKKAVRASVIEQVIKQGMLDMVRQRKMYVELFPPTRNIQNDLPLMKWALNEKKDVEPWSNTIASIIHHMIPYNIPEEQKVKYPLMPELKIVTLPPEEKKEKLCGTGKYFDTLN